MESHYWNMNGHKHKINILHECDSTSHIININPLLNEKNFRISTYYQPPHGGKYLIKN